MSLLNNTIPSGRLFGRTEEINNVVNALANPSCRLMSILGPGGIGKSAIAAHVLHQVLDRFVDGGFFINLTHTSSVEQILQALVSTIDIPSLGKSDPREQVTTYLKEKQLLIVLDGVEPIIRQVASIISSILSIAPKVQILTTSRERINLREEHILFLDGLACHSSESDNFLSPATQLFMYHGTRLQSNLEMEVDSITRICQLVDGMPLAIELAASWVHILSCEEIAKEIKTGFGLLETNLRDIPKRHQSIRAIFDQSWRLLSSEEQSLFMKLSVFTSSFDRKAAEAISTASLSLLSALVDKSIVRINSTGRLQIHELLRQYSADHLELYPEIENEVINKYSDYYLHFVAHQSLALKDDHHYIAVEQLKMEMANIRKAWQWMVNTERFEVIVKVWEGFFLFITRMNWFHEGYALFEPLTHIDGLDRPIEAIALTMTGWFKFRLGYIEESISLLTRGRNLLKKDDNSSKKLYFISELCLGYVMLTTGDNQNAEPLMTECLSISTIINEPFYLAYAHNGLGRLFTSQQQYAAAEKHFIASIEISNRAGIAWGSAWNYLDLGTNKLALDQYEDAKFYLSESLRLFDQTSDLWGQATSLARLGQVEHALSDYSNAVRSLKKGLSIATGNEMTSVTLELASRLALLLARIDRSQDAIQLASAIRYQEMAYEPDRIRAQQVLNLFESRDFSTTDLDNNITIRTSRDGELVEHVTLLLQDENLLNPNWHDPKGSHSHPKLHSVLSERELEVLELASGGSSNKSIAEKLFISIGTVKRHMFNINAKLETNNRVQAIQRARELSLL